MDDIKLEYFKLDEEEDRYNIYHNGKLLEAMISVIHTCKKISFYRFSHEFYYDIALIAPEIFKLFEEHIRPEYEEYYIAHDGIIGNELYWIWKENK